MATATSYENAVRASSVKFKKLTKLNISGGDALMGNTRSHPEHDG